MKIMMIIVVGIFINLLISGVTVAERGSSRICSPRVPTITLEEALSIARKHVGSQWQDLQNIFVDVVSLECENNVHYWKAGFRLREYESGHWIVNIYMDGSITETVVKDG